MSAPRKTPYPASAEESGSTQRDELITASGIRITGKGAKELAEQLANAPTLLPGRDEDALFGARFTVRPRIGSGSPVNTVLELLGNAIRRHMPDAAPLTREHPLRLPASRFGGVFWDTTGERGSWVGELVWRLPHPAIAGAPITTHVVPVEQPGQTQLHLRVTADTGTASVRGNVGAGQARPAFLTDLNRALRLVWDGSGEGIPELADSEIDPFVRNVLLGEGRTVPAALLAPLEDGSYVVDPAELADALLGIATLHAIPRHATTYRLSDALGDRRLSAYWGALRAYMPGFSCADAPHEHPRLVKDELIDPVMRADFFGRLGRSAAARTPMPPGIRERQTEPAAQSSRPAQSPTETEPGPPITGTPATNSASSSAPAASDRELTVAVARLSEMTGRVLEELTRLRTTMAVRSASTSGLERRIEHFGALLARMLAPPEAEQVSATIPDEATEERDEEGAPTLVDVLRQAGDAHPDTLLVLDDAERSAASSPYEDLERVGVVLDAMAEVARRRMEGALGGSLRDAFRELGVEYRQGISDSTPARLRQQYRIPGLEGHIYDCVEHIALGASYDPRYCLRIYFTSRAPLEGRFVIGHVGRHFDVQTTT